MSKTADEIKKGLEHCINGTSCRGCPYCEECAIASDCNPMQKDLQGYIQQLESDNQQLEGMLTHMNQLRDAAAGRALQMEERVHQLEADLEDMTTRYKIADDCAKKKGEMNEKLYAELAAVKAERDALIYDIEEYCAECALCKHYTQGPYETPCNSCKHMHTAAVVSMWEWRGV